MVDRLISLSEAANRFRMDRKIFFKQYIETGKILVVPRQYKSRRLLFVSANEFNDLIQSEKMIHRKAV